MEQQRPYTPVDDFDETPEYKEWLEQQKKAAENERLTQRD